MVIYTKIMKAYRGSEYIAADSRDRRSDDNDTWDLGALPERHPDWPPIELSFYFAPHGSYEDIRGIEPYIAECDVLLFEEAGESKWPKKYLNKKVRSATGPLEDLIEPVEGEVEEAFVRAMYGTDKVAGCIDIGRNPKRNALLEDALCEMDSLGMPDDISWREAMMTLLIIESESVNLQGIREEVMVNNFELELDDLITKYPELKNRDKLKVLISVGSFHTSLQHRFAARGLGSERYFPSKPYIYDPENEVGRSIMFGIPVRERSLGQAVVERTFRSLENRAEGIGTTDEQSGRERALLNAMSDKALKAVFKDWRRDNLGYEYQKALYEAHGLKMPYIMRPKKKKSKKSKHHK